MTMAAIRVSVALFLGLVVVGCQDNESANPDGLLNRGMEAAAAGDFDSAIECYTEAIRLKPDCVQAYTFRALAYEKKNEPDKAALDFAEVRRLGFLPKQ